VSSKTIITPAIGAPMTEEETAAIPQTTIPRELVISKPTIAPRYRANAPAAAPTNRDGENMPPNKPKLLRTAKAKLVGAFRVICVKVNTYTLKSLNVDQCLISIVIFIWD
jgi:hypothetical protein